MITGIQITKAANDDLLNSFWLLDSEKGEARCPVSYTHLDVYKRQFLLCLLKGLLYHADDVSGQ